mmetsp:Transcript_138402/g.442276  ORF Transcript_138402/g.442276 Transcript_138402/m.442276 type:complete len:534 (+) Transcript_138402:598-2199(+)
MPANSTTSSLWPATNRSKPSGETCQMWRGGSTSSPRSESAPWLLSGTTRTRSRGDEGCKPEPGNDPGPIQRSRLRAAAGPSSTAAAPEAEVDASGRRKRSSTGGSPSSGAANKRCSSAGGIEETMPENSPSPSNGLSTSAPKHASNKCTFVSHGFSASRSNCAASPTARTGASKSGGGAGWPGGGGGAGTACSTCRHNAAAAAAPNASVRASSASASSCEARPASAAAASPKYAPCNRARAAAPSAAELPLVGPEQSPNSNATNVWNRSCGVAAACTIDASASPSDPCSAARAAMAPERSGEPSKASATSSRISAAEPSAETGADELAARVMCEANGEDVDEHAPPERSAPPAPPRVALGAAPGRPRRRTSASVAASATSLVRPNQPAATSPLPRPSRAPRASEGRCPASSLRSCWFNCSSKSADAFACLLRENAGMDGGGGTSSAPSAPTSPAASAAPMAEAPAAGIAGTATSTSAILSSSQPPSAPSRRAAGDSTERRAPEVAQPAEAASASRGGVARGRPGSRALARVPQ